MEDEKTIEQLNKQHEESIKAIKEEYEKKLNDTESKYKTLIDEIQSNHISEIREIMRTGTSPEAQEIQQEDDRYEDEIILEHLKNKYKL